MSRRRSNDNPDTNKGKINKAKNSSSSNNHRGKQQGAVAASSNLKSANGSGKSKSRSSIQDASSSTEGRKGSASDEAHKQGLCHAFQRGECRYGDHCRYSHNQGQKRKEGNENARDGGLHHKPVFPSNHCLELSPDVHRFWKSIHDRVSVGSRSGNQIFDYSSDSDIKLWHQCWAAAATDGVVEASVAATSSGAKGVPVDWCLALCTAYQALPLVDSIHPLQVYVLQVLHIIATRTRQLSKGGIAGSGHGVRNTQHEGRSKGKHPGGDRGKSGNTHGKAPDPSGQAATSSSLLVVFHGLADVVEKRLLPCSAIGQPLDEGGLGRAIDLVKALNKSCSSELFKLYADLSPSLGQPYLHLMGKVAGLCESYTSKLHSAWDQAQFHEATHGPADDGSAASLRDVPWHGWRKRPTIGWLISDSWHRGVPELCSVYESPAAYAESLQRIWTLLTFYWGAGALWPRCPHRTGGGAVGDVCGEPMLMPIERYETVHTRQRGGLVVCTNRIQSVGGGGSSLCGQPAEWCCHRFNHGALCSSCLRRRQEKLLGPGRAFGATPGASAGAGAENRSGSTDVYDAVVEREKLDSRGQVGEVLLLSHVQSRRPPTIAPNWRTTGRLQNAALVGVVKLSAENEPLRRDMPIWWAELISRVEQGGDPREDSSFKQQGKFALRLLQLEGGKHQRDRRGSNAVVGGPLGLEHRPGAAAAAAAAASSAGTGDGVFEAGARVALVDLKVFVPEVVSVLTTFAEPSFVEHLNKIPFINQLIGLPQQPGSNAAAAAAVANYRTMNHSVLFDAIHKAVMTSQLDCIMRLPEQFRSDLAQRIFALKPVKTLYGTQLDAFARALELPTHCTQGPPGTGKSYVGVCVVVALMEVRRAVRQSGAPPLGPILMLSYKNHALDEFLKDILKFSPLRQGELIRCGRVETPGDELQRFTERVSKGETAAQKKLLDLLTLLKYGREVVKQWNSIAQQAFTRSIQVGELLPTAPESEPADICSTTSELVVLAAELLKVLVLLCIDDDDHASILDILAPDIDGIDNNESTNFPAPTTASADAGAAAMAQYLRGRHNRLEIGGVQVNASGVLRSIGSNRSPVEPLIHFLKEQLVRLNLDENQRAYGQVVLEALQDISINSMNQIGENWYQQCMHWRNAQLMESPPSQRKSVRFWLEQWLLGSSPPPRCAAYEGVDASGKPQQCLECVDTDRPGGCYCTIHHACKALRGDCVRLRAPGFDFCAEHCCRAQEVLRAATIGGAAGCKYERLTGSMYCVDHSCVLCLEVNAAGALNATSGITVNPQAPGSKACQQHQCSASSCESVRLPPHPYCPEHCCLECLATGSDSVLEAVRGRRYCALHACAHPTSVCLHARALQSLFCVNHTCFVCASERELKGDKVKELITRQVMEEPPRNTCSVHPLCQKGLADGRTCGTLAVAGELFCTYHLKGRQSQEEGSAALTSEAAVVFSAIDGQCCGLSKKKKMRCQRRDPNLKLQTEPWFCADHEGQRALINAAAAVQDEPSPPPPPPHQQMAPTNQNMELPPFNGQRVHVVRCCVHDNVRHNQCNNPVLVLGDHPDASINDNYRCFAHNQHLEQQDGARLCSDRKASGASVGTGAGKAAAKAQTAAIGVPHSSKPAPADEAAAGGLDQRSSQDAALTDGRLAREALSRREQADGAAASAVIDDTIVDLDDDCSFADAAYGAAVDKDELDLLPDADYDEQYGLRDGLIGSVRDVVGGAIPSDMLGGKRHGDSSSLGTGVRSGTVDIDESSDTGDDERQQRLRDIGADDDDDNEESTNGDVSDAGEDFVHQSRSNAAGISKRATPPQNILRDWSWSMPPSERWMGVSDFMRGMSDVLQRLMELIDASEVTDARRARMQAGADIYKNAQVIGATVVGAARRLEVIRAAEPFAVVVEEACEVMEPTLISVLAVGSLNKLELVGDHRQLPASVQQDWFNLESYLPSIKTSLFERLVTGTMVRVGGAPSGRHSRSHRGSGGSATDAAAECIPCDVLDEQRRMRSSIADLTRSFYEDVVIIQDHAVTAKQLIGGRLFDKKSILELKKHSSLWSRSLNAGRDVPGIQRNIYFWNLPNNRENDRGNRPKGLGGISACNEVEANATVALARYLQLCGVPTSGITIITPYKGQKMLIQQLLRKSAPRSKHTADTRSSRCSGGGGGAKSSSMGGYAEMGDEVFVSTVDRFQGDENDIVILSMVRTRPGNMFVALVNRFIVAVSRARLGFYVVGSVEAVASSRHGGEGKGPPHWVQLLEHLGQPQCGACVPSRAGPALPLCCPRHVASSSKPVRAAGDIPTHSSWRSFCQERCPFRLPRCEHHCAKSCHSPQLTAHTTQEECNVSVDHPCPFHVEIALRCHELRIAEGESLTEALKRYECPQIVEYRRPECGHELQLMCHERVKLERGTIRLKKECDVSVSDFYFPQCGHVIKKPKCYLKREWEESAPRCNEKVWYTRPCECKVRINCYEKQAEERTPVRCQEAVTISRPRCRHKLSMRCYDASTLKSRWLEKLAQDHKHVTVVEEVPTADSASCIIRLQHGHYYGIAEDLISDKVSSCAQEVQLEAPCGHVMKFPCDAAFSYAGGMEDLPRCKQEVTAPCALCNNDIKLPCWMQQYPPMLKRLAHSSSPNNLIREEDVHDYATRLITEVAALPPEVTRFLSNVCKAGVQIVRACGLSSPHFQKFQCSTLLSRVLQAAANAGAGADIGNSVVAGVQLGECTCAADEQYSYPCGIHFEKPRLCHELQTLKRDRPFCRHNSRAMLHRCRHIVSVQCCEVAQASKPYGNPAPVTPDGQPLLVDAEGLYADVPSTLPRCSSLVRFKHRPCGHTHTTLVKCADAFAWAEENSLAPNCQTLIEVENPVCGHSSRIPCHLWNLAVVYQPWAKSPTGRPPAEVVSSGPVDETDVARELRLVHEHLVSGDARPEKGSAVISKCFECSEQVVLIRKCGHECVASCSDAHFGRVGKCGVLETVQCVQPDCGIERKFSCHELCELRRSGQEQPPCDNRIEKECTVCHINRIDVPCRIRAVECKRAVRGLLWCGHEAQWHCGTDTDPRLDPSFVCFGCEIPLWHDVLTGLDELAKAATTTASEIVDSSTVTTTAALNKFDFYAREKIERALHGLCCHEVSSQPLDSCGGILTHIKGKCALFGRLVDGMQSGGLKALCAPSFFGSEEDRSRYQVVFKQISASSPIATSTTTSITSTDFGKQVSTPYGRGVELLALTDENLRSLTPDPDSECITLCIGLGYAFNFVRDHAPFVAAGSATTAQNGQKANKKAENWKSRGYDGVALSGGDGATGNAKREQFIFWEPGAVIPFCTVMIRLFGECSICLDPEVCRSSGGYECAHGHVTCWACLKRHAENAQIPGSMGQYVDERGNLRCAGRCSAGATGGGKDKPCKEVYDFIRVSSTRGGGTTVAEASAALMQLHMTVHSRREVAAAVEAEKQKLTAEFQRIQQIKDADERRAHTLRLELVEEVLTFRCPRCRRAFVDFDGCCALTCCNSDCECGFCAWCLKDCGEDAHSHVPRCPDWNSQVSERSMWANPEEWNRFHNKRKGRILDEKLDEQESRVASITYELLQNDISGSGIRLRPRAAASARSTDRSSRADRPSHHALIPWKIEGTTYAAAGLTKFSLKCNEVGGAVSREATEFNTACGHFARLMGNRAQVPSRIDVLVYEEHSPVQRRFEQKRGEFQDQNKCLDEVWVFHGTDQINSIAQRGFIAGGQDGVPIRNGSAYGRGVYTAVGPNTPMGYSANGAIILARGLVGAAGDHKCPNGDWYIFSDGAQLLPCYVLYF